MTHAATTYCAEVLSLAPAPAGRPPPQAKVVLIAQRVDGFFLERLGPGGERLGRTQHETLDEAMYQAHAEYTLSEWRFCPDDADPLEYVRRARATPHE